MPDHVDLPIGSPRVLRAAELAARGGLKLALVPTPQGNYRRHHALEQAETYRALLATAGHGRLTGSTPSEEAILA